MKGNRVYILVFTLALALGAYVTEATAGVSPLSACGGMLGSDSYVLTQNISTTVDCLTLTGDDISIDLNGFTIDGDDGGSDVGITDGGMSRQNIVIRNGTIKDFGVGIDLSNSDGCKVEWILAFSDTGDGIRVGSHCHVSHNIANLNGSRGIFTGADCTISHNISNNNQDGIVAFNGGSNISYNTANGNLNFG